jgi:hypothetical protein
MMQEQKCSSIADFEQHQHLLARIIARTWLLVTKKLRYQMVKLRGARTNAGLRLLRNYLDPIHMYIFNYSFTKS